MTFSTHLIRNGVTRWCKQSNTSFVTSRAFFTTTHSESTFIYKPFATAESDFLSPSHLESQLTKQQQPSSNQYDQVPYQPIATSLSDFMSPTEFEQTHTTQSSTSWYDDDLSARADVELLQSIAAVHHQEANLNHNHPIDKDIFDYDKFRENSVYALSFASPESDFISDRMTDQMKDQMTYIEQETSTKYTTVPLHMKELVRKKSTHRMATTTTPTSPLLKTFQQEVFAASPDALVVTEKVAPYRIVSVNPAWEQLCGFTKKESIGKTLNILQGPTTDKTALTALLAQILKGEEAGIEITNYSKNGKKFQNRLTMGSLRNDETNDISHFIGLLKEVQTSSSATVLR